MKRGTGLKDILQVLLIALIFGALFTGIAVGISLALGARIGGGSDGSASSGNGAGGPTTVAAAGTPLPGETAVPTEVPCDAPVWWLTTGPGLSTTISDLLGLDVALPPAQIKQTSDRFNTWRTAFQAIAYPPCVGAAHDALADFAARGRALLDSYLTTTTSAARAQLTLNMLNSLLTASDEITTLGVARPDGAEDAWIAEVQDFHRNACPAPKWFLETMVARDYQRFFSILGNTSLSTMSISQIQEQLRSMRTLRDAYRTDMASFPDCVKPAADRLLGGMDAFLDTINQQLNGNPNASNSALERAKLEVSSFFAQVAQLLPAEDQGLLRGAQAELAATPVPK